MDRCPGLISLHHRRHNTWRWRRGLVWSDHKVTAGGDIGEDASVWVLCQMNNAIGRGISDVPSVWAGQRRSCVTHGRCVWSSQKWETRKCDVHVQWTAERIKHMLTKLYSPHIESRGTVTKRGDFVLKILWLDSDCCSITQALEKLDFDFLTM